jgi:hypothetical protein
MRIFVSNMEKGGGWTKLRNEEQGNLLLSPCTIRVMKSKRIRWAGHVPGMRVEE